MVILIFYRKMYPKGIQSSDMDSATDGFSESQMTMQEFTNIGQTSAK